MKKLAVTAVIIAGMAFSHADAFAQYKTANAPEDDQEAGNVHGLRHEFHHGRSRR